MKQELDAVTCLKIGAKQVVEHQIVIFHHAGGSRLAFLNWAEHVNSSTELLFIDLPRRMNPIPSTTPNPDQLFQEIADCLSTEITTQFTLFGHSMGALVAFGVIPYLKTPPSSLVISASPPPNTPERSLSHLSDTELVCHLQKLGGTPQELLENEGFLEWLLKLYRFDLALIEAFHFSKKRLSLPILAIGGKRDPLATPKQLLQWKEWTNHYFESLFFEDGHFFCFTHKKPLIHSIETFAKKHDKILCSTYHS